MDRLIFLEDHGRLQHEKKSPIIQNKVNLQFKNFEDFYVVMQFLLIAESAVKSSFGFD